MCDRKCCIRLGRVTKNGYLNFPRAYKKKHCDFSSATELVNADASALNKLKCEQKGRYKHIKRRRSRRRRKSSCRPRSQTSCRPRSQSSCRPRSQSNCRPKSQSSCRPRSQSSCPPRHRPRCRPRRRRHSCKPKRNRNRSTRLKKCMQAGPITNNGYLNFLGIYRRKCYGMSPLETIERGAKIWFKLPCRQKMKYERMARKQACGSKRRRSCSAS